MPDLVALDLPAGAGFVDALRAAWDRGDAVLPLDRRLPAPARAALLDELAPTVVVDGSGSTRRDGRGVEAGDALVVATSGSTGRPKGVVLTHDAVRASAAATSARLGISSSDRWLACLPLSHVGGLAVVTRALLTDVDLVVHDGFDADAVMAAAREGATAVSLVATTLTRIDPALFRVIVLGGARPPAERPPNTFATYGLTETGSGVVYDGVPLDGVDVRIEPLTRDDVSGRDEPASSPDSALGAVLLRAPMLLRCYRDGTDPRRADGWFDTGDLGRRRADGRLHVEGRRGDLIITGGENVWPEPVEEVLTSHPHVADVGVAGVDDEEWGQRVTAFVVAAGAPPTLADLRAHVAAALPVFCAPKEIHLVERIPRTALGKVQRHLLVASLGHRRRHQ